MGKNGRMLRSLALCAIVAACQWGGYLDATPTVAPLICRTVADSRPFFECSPTQTNQAGAIYSDYCCATDGYSGSGTNSGTGCTPRAIGDACGAAAHFQNCCTQTGLTLSCLSQAVGVGETVCPAPLFSYCCAQDPATSLWSASSCVAQSQCDQTLYPRAVCCNTSGSSAGIPPSAAGASGVARTITAALTGSPGPPLGFAPRIVSWRGPAPAPVPAPALAPSLAPVRSAPLAK